MIFPVFAILIDFLILDRRKPCLAYVFIILFALGIATEASLAQNAGGAMSATSSIPLWYRLLNAITALTVYLGNFILPLNLAPQCLLRYPDLPRFSPVGSIALGSIVTWIVLVWRNKLSPHFSILSTLKTPREAIGWCNAFVADIPTPLCGLLIFFLSLVPFLGLIGFGIHAFADRFTLRPAIGLSILLLSILPPSRHAPRSTLYASLLVCVVLFFSFRTHHQVSFWENDGRLFDHTAAVDGDRNAHALVNAAKYYYEFEHDLAKAHDRLARALKGRNGLDEVGRVGNIYMEAAFVAKDDEDMDNCLTWLSQWDDRESERMQIETGIFSNCHSIPYATAEILRLATKPGLYETATNKFEALKRNLPRHHSVRVLAYRLAEIKGDPQEIAARKAECADCDDDPYIRNRWAR